MSTAGFAVVALLLFGCTKVSVTPLGSTADGRRQFELTCNEHAFSNGTCNREAVAACRGDYETQGVLNSMSPSFASDGQVHVAVVGRVLLVACNARSAPVRARALERL